MQSAASSVLVLAALAFGTAQAARENGKATPVQKVLDLMHGMLAKGKEEKHAEQVQFAAYKQFCDDTTVEKQRAIAKADEKIGVLKADIEKYAADAAQLTAEIAEHEEDIAVWTGDIKAANKVRDIEKAEYEALHKDYSESVDALGRAIEVLKKQAYERKQTAFAQVSSLKTLTLVPPEAKKAIDAFLQQDPEEGLAVSAPEAFGYEFQSHGIIEMLEELLDKFIAERTALEKDEMNTQHAFEMLVQDLTAQIAQASEDKDQKTETKAKKLEAKATAEADLEDTTTTRDDDQKYLDDLTAVCSQKTSDFESRQQLRADEIVAIEKAIEIISAAAVSGNAETYLPTLVQKRSPVGLKKGSSLASLRSDTHNPSQKEAATYLNSRATELGSRVLSMLATRVSADPFTKVKKMLKDLIVRLMEEANAEAEHKGWCDTELATNENTRKEKTAAVETLHAEIDELEASIAKETAEIAALTQAVAELDTAMAKATSLRNDEKATNEETVKDAGEAQTAVAQALTVLKEFYAKAGDAVAFVQQPAIFDSPYKGMQSEAGGVVGMLEVIESDFARLEAETKAAEATAQKEYDTFMTDSKVDKAAKQTDIEHKTSKKQDEEQALVVAGKDLEGTQKELDAALMYFDKLKPSCVDADVSYDDRVARRKEEIESLQEALRILNGKEIV
jgi:hypothetical protein